MIDMETLEQVADYAKLSMKDGDLEEINRRLKIIYKIGGVELGSDDFDHFASFSSLDCALREDTPRPSMTREELLRNAPNAEAGCFCVPKLMGGDS